MFVFGVLALLFIVLDGDDETFDNRPKVVEYDDDVVDADVVDDVNESLYLLVPENAVDAGSFLLLRPAKELVDDVRCNGKSVGGT